MAQLSCSSSTITHSEGGAMICPASLAPIVSSDNTRIRPILDAVDKLRNLMIMKEDIQLPTIVVVGDQSSGKSAVLESLSGIYIPRGRGICSRVPLIMKLQHHSAEEPQIYLEYSGKTVDTEEEYIWEDINTATFEIAGSGEGISKTPLTLVVKKKGVPDLTMVDLPGITRVAIKDQPKDIYDQIKDIIMEYITPEESIILNVLSATVDFSTCESIVLSHSVDKTGLRTLAVVTKSDSAPEGLLEQVTANDVNIGLGYVCVRNRIGEESFEEAQQEEADLFGNHPLLSKIDKSIVGIPNLVKRLVQLQATNLSRCMPDIIKQINEKLTFNICELNKTPKKLSSVTEAMTTFMQIIAQAKESLRKIFLRGEYENYGGGEGGEDEVQEEEKKEDDEKMHCTARLVAMINQYSSELHEHAESDLTKNFLKAEIKVLEEARGTGFPKFLPQTAFLSILHKKVNAISGVPVKFVENVWDYIQGVFLSVLMQHSENYHQLQVPIKRAGKQLAERMKEESIDLIKEVVEMQKMTDYTCDPQYIAEWNKLMLTQDLFRTEVLRDAPYRPDSVNVEGVGNVEIGDLWKHPDVLNQAYYLKMRMIAYWKIVLTRLVDCTALHLQLSLQRLVNKEMEKETISEFMSLAGGGIEKMLEESPSLAVKREKLKSSIKLLRESKEVVSGIIESVSCYAEN